MTYGHPHMFVNVERPDYSAINWEDERASYDMRHVMRPDKAIFTLLPPEPMDGVLAHEIGHLERGDCGPFLRGMKRESARTTEFAADRAAAEITGKPLALAEALQRLHDYKSSLAAASPEFRVKRVPYRWRDQFRNMRDTQSSWRDAIHPSNAERIERLGTFAEAIEKGNFDTLPSGRTVFKGI
jgi:hypothetical protein